MDDDTAGGVTSEFAPGDKVLVEATVLPHRIALVAADGLVFVDIDEHRLYLSPHVVRPVPEPPYVEPELVPGMVVMSTDESDRRLWMFATDSNGEDPWFGDPEGEWFVRAELPAEIRPVFDPRKVTS